MLEHVKRREVIFIIVLITFLVGVFYFYKGQTFKDAKPAASARKGKVVVSDSAKAKQQYLKRFEITLNEFLKDVYEEVNAYKQRRRILDEIIRPDNLRNEKYIAEGYALAMRTIPDLKERSGIIISKFNEKEVDIKRLIQNRGPEAQKTIMGAWNEMKREQVNLYVSYFNIEQDILDLYGKFITTYYKNRGVVIYDKAQNRVSFEDLALNAEVQQTRQAIRALKKKQSALAD